MASVANAPLDCNGREIMVGDLLRTFHFRDRTANGRNTYLYHGVVSRDGHLEAVPVGELCGKPPNGGRYWLRGEQSAEIVYGINTVGGNVVAFYDRPNLGTARTPTRPAADGGDDGT